MCEMLAMVLQDAGFVVRTATNGLEALLEAYDMRPAVIVMDISMPVLDGIEATRLIKATEATRHARVIACTGSPPREDDPAHQLFAAVLVKPTAPALVVATVQQMASPPGIWLRLVGLGRTNKRDHLLKTGSARSDRGNPTSPGSAAG